MSDLMNCPFCNGNADYAYMDVETEEGVCVLCKGCAVTTAILETEEQAMTVWNSRHDDNEAQVWADQYEEEQQKRYRAEEVRDVYKTRCEAYHRAMIDEDVIDYVCVACISYKLRHIPMGQTPCGECEFGDSRTCNFEFDEEKFAR